jgi:hypothetical protein
MRLSSAFRRQCDEHESSKKDSFLGMKIAAELLFS